MKYASSLPLLTLLTLSLTTQAHAASIDYSTLQELFGEPVTTAATGTPLKASEVATNMTIITQDEIRQSGSRSLATIIGTRVAGMDVFQSARAGFDVAVRGSQRPSQPHLLVLIDGRQAFLDDYSRTPWESLPVNIDDIRQIEVVKGPSSALFGSNAAGGVVNIITNNPLYDTKNVATVGIGTDGYMTGDATATFKTGSSGGVKISAGGMNEDEFNTKRYAHEDRLKTDPYRRYASAVGNYMLTPKFQVNTEATYSQSKKTDASITWNLLQSKLLTYSALAGFTWDTPYGQISNNTYVNHSDSTALPADYNERFDQNVDLYVTQLEDQFKIGSDHIVRLAAEYRNKSFDISHGPKYAFNWQEPGFVEDVFAGGATWHWTMSDKLSWTNALRVDHTDIRLTGSLAPTDINTKSGYSHAINTLSANSGLVYKATDNDSFSVTYGRGVQMPTMAQTGFSMDMPMLSGFVMDVMGSPQLKPTIVQSYEIGYDRKLSSIHSNAHASVFYELTQDVAANTPISPVFLLGGSIPAVKMQTTTIGKSQGWGFETGLKGNYNGFRWDGSYSLSRISDSEDVARYINFRGSAPAHHVRLLGGYTTGQWEFDVNGQYLSSTDIIRGILLARERQPRNGYITLGGRVGYNITDRFTVAASGTQLNQSRRAVNPYLPIERQMMLTFSGKF